MFRKKLSVNELGGVLRLWAAYIKKLKLDAVEAHSTSVPQT